MSTPNVKPILFLFKVGFEDKAAGPEIFYCPFCMRIEGMLSVFPVLREELDIRYVPFAKPRGDLPLHAGPTEQSCPKIVLTEGDDSVSGRWSVAGENGSRRIDKTSEISEYLSARFDLPIRHP